MTSHCQLIPLRRFALATALLTLSTAVAGAQEPAPITAGVAPAPGPIAPGVDVQHYEVELALGAGSDRIEARAELTVAVTGQQAVLPLDFTGLEITRLTVDGRTLPYTHTEGVVRIPLSGSAPGDLLTVALDYRGVPDDGLLLRNNVHGDPVAFVDNWPNRTRFWLPSVDHPDDKATVRYTIHAPTAWTVIANGQRLSGPAPTASDALGSGPDRRTWVWEVGVPISSYNMVIGAAQFEIRTVGLAACGRAPASRRDDGCVEVSTWMFPQDVQKAEPSFRRAAQMVDVFTEVIGDFPFEKLANVQSTTRFGGMENASAIFYSEQALASGRNMEETVSHEIAHQWFGDAVTEASWHHLWLSEGFATYFGDHFFEVADGRAAFSALMETSRQRVVTSDDVERPVIDPEETDLFALLNANNYPKGGWVLHMLRGLLGDEAFFAGIRTYYARHLHSAVLTEDFQAVMEEVSHRDLDWFFTQWLYRPGYPVFELEERWNAGEGSAGVAEVTVRQVQKDAWPRFRVPLELCWGDGTDRQCRAAVAGSASDTFRFQFDTRPTAPVALDPDGWVLKETRP
jgi:aminopeptidase N